MSGKCTVKLTASFGWLAGQQLDDLCLRKVAMAVCPVNQVRPELITSQTGFFDQQTLHRHTTDLSAVDL